MESWYNNPYPEGTTQHEIWEVLIKNDFEGFLSKGWDFVKDDFIEDGFFGIDMAKSDNPQNWKLTYPTLGAYRDAWVKDSLDFAGKQFISDPREIFYRTTKLENFDFQDNQVLVHKVFNGVLELANGETIELKWRSLFLLRNKQGWKIAGFCGYMHE